MTFDDTLTGQILGRFLSYEYEVTEEQEGLEIEVTAAFTSRGGDPMLTADEYAVAEEELKEYENDKYMERETGFTSGHLRRMRND